MENERFATLYPCQDLQSLLLPEQPRDRLLISFRIQNPASPASIGESADSRLLGLGMRRMWAEHIAVSAQNAISVPA